MTCWWGQVAGTRPHNDTSTVNCTGDGGFHELDGHTRPSNIVGSNYGCSLLGDNQSNTLTGGRGNDILAGLGGVDTLVGRGGYDDYRFDEGQVRIVNGFVGQGGPMGEMDFGPQLTAANLWLDRVDRSGNPSDTGNDLRFSVLGTASCVIVQDWFLDPAAQLSRELLLGSGWVLDGGTSTLVAAMSAFEQRYLTQWGQPFVPAIAGPTSVDPTVLSAIAAAWHT